MLRFSDEVDIGFDDGTQEAEIVIATTTLFSNCRAFHFSDWPSGRSGTKGIQFFCALVLGLLVLNGHPW